MQEVKIPVNTRIKRILLIESDHHLSSIQFFDKNNQCILKAGKFDKKYVKCREAILEDDERIVGVVS